MRLIKYVLFCAVIALCILEQVTARKSPSFGSRGGSHSYPRSGGLSGGGHGYPSSGGGLSGGGHGYPSSGGGLSGGGHGYPSSGGSHGYPPSGGLSGHGTGNKYPSSGSNQGSGGLSGSGSHGYPSSGSGLSGAGHGYPQRPPSYQYNPPKQIVYTPTHGAPVNYPVYRGQPPSYVYQYKDSGSKYGTLLAGLALMNLGTLGLAAYAVHNSNQNHGGGGGNSYQATPGEVCKLGIRKENGDYEENKIDCQVISSFILSAEAEKKNNAHNTTVVTTTTVTNVTTVNGNTNETDAAHATQAGTLFKMMPDGTLVPINGTTPVNVTTQNDSTNNSVTSVVTTTVTNTTTNALDVKGDPVKVTDGMKCIIIRTTPVSKMEKTIPCSVLQQYATQSLKKNSASRSAPAFTIMAVVFAVFIMHS